MIGIFILLIYGLIFLLCQSEATKTLAITDVNNYIYIAKLMSEGKLLYKDIFLDNFPLAAYIGFFYRTITFGDMHLFRLTGTIEALALTGILYHYEWKKSKSMWIGLFVALTFCSSVLFMRTAFDQSGLFTSLLFFITGFIFWEKKRFTLSGVLIALAVLTKAYMFPLGLALFVSTIILHRKETVRFTIAGISTGVIILLPTILFAFPQFIEQTMKYGLVRSSIESKFYIFEMFKYDLLLVAWFFSAWFIPKKSLPIWLMAIFTPLFFFVYRDFYYVYFTMLGLVAVLAAGVWFRDWQKHRYWKYIQIAYAVILIFTIFWNAWFILTYSKDTQILPNIDELYSAIKKENPDYLYGNASITNGLSYQLKIPPFKNFVDYTGNQFETGRLNKTKLTEEVVNSRTLIIVTAIKQKDRVVPETVMIDPAVMAKAKCRNVYQHPLTRYKGIDFKYLVLIKCYN